MKKLLILLLCLPLIAGATNYYIADAGNNSAAGTSQGTAWQTSSKLSSVTLNPGDSVLYKCGDVFFGSIPINFSGTNIAAITFGSYGSGALPLITGLISVTGWTSAGGGIWEAPCIGAKITNNLYVVNGQIGFRASTPNSAYFNFTSYGSNFVYDNTLAISHSGSAIGVKSSRFTIDLLGVSSQSNDSMYLNAATSYTNQPVTGYFFYNNLSDLDSSTEYVMRHNGDSVMGYFGGTNPNLLSVGVSKNDTLIYCTKSYIHFVNLHLQGGNLYTFFANGGVGVQVLNCLVDYNGMNGVVFYNCSSSLVDHTNVKMSNSNGIMYLPNCPYATVTNDTVQHTALLRGMMQSGQPNVVGVGISNINNVKDFVVMFCMVDSTGFNGIDWSGDSTIIKFNHVRGFCSIKDDGGGIYGWINSAPGYTNRPQIEFNLVENGNVQPLGEAPDQTSTRDGIYDDSHMAQTDILYNQIQNVTSGVFIHGPNNRIDSNKIYNCPWAMIYFQEVAGVTISLCEVKGNQFAAANTGQKLIAIATNASDLSTLCSLMDFNIHLTPTGSNAQFWTKSSTDNGTSRTIGNFATTVGYETHSTLTNANPILFTNPNPNMALVAGPGQYTGVDGTVYGSLVPVSAYSGVMLKQTITGFFKINQGSPVHINF